MTTSLLVELLAAQQELTPVERLARRYDETPIGRAGSLRELIPSGLPGPGQQYAFAVDLDACTGCKSCVSACHSLNGLDADESWRSVGFLHTTDPGDRFQQTVTTACHHCVEPGCLAGCPVDAYEKDPVTGIVIHLDDQCIGCSYCTLTCPYEVPRYNHARGIVRKCDMCHGRLAEGEAPACAQACPNGAIQISIVEVADLVRDAAGSTLVPGAPPSSLTVPSTSYRTAKGPAAVPTGQRNAVLAGDAHMVHPSQAHPPLAIMLVLTQLSVGAFVADLALDGRHTLLALSMGLLALAASVLHLGRPLLAWRAAIGIRHSWLSREAVAFGVFAGLATLHFARPAPFLGWATALAGIAGVACSVKIYAVTGRRWWRTSATTARFGLTTAIGGLAVELSTAPRVSLATGLVVLVVAKLAWELTWLLPLSSRPESAATARLLRRDLAPQFRARVGLALVGGVLLPLALAGSPSILFGGLMLLALAGGELVERSLFFTAVTGPRMPGALR